jgi:thiamine-monophosphate kinase
VVNEKKLRDLGEAGILARIFERLGPAGPGVLVGPGDDAAALAGSGADAVVFASDAMVESVHFDLAFMTAADVGWRLTCANLSDLAAMGAEPWAAVISVAAPASTPATAIESFYDGAAELSRREGLALVGGDVVASPAGLFFAMAVIGRAAGGKCLTRGGAAPGDRLLLTGEIGSAQAGLHVLGGEGECGPAAAEEATSRYRRPTPRVEKGRRLLGENYANAAIDTSDSLSTSAHHLARASGVTITLDSAALPVSEAARDVAASRGEDAVSYALAAGEDFELLFTCPADRASEAAAAAEGRIIGTVSEGEPKVLLIEGSEEKPLAPEGFSHFGAFSGGGSDRPR